MVDDVTSFGIFKIKINKGNKKKIYKEYPDKTVYRARSVCGLVVSVIQEYNLQVAYTSSFHP